MKIIIRLAVVFSLLLEGCRVVPLQMVRVTQTESFVQTFDALRVAAPMAATQDRPLNWDQNRLIDETFTRMLGEGNFQHVKDRYGLKGVRDELLAGKIMSQGQLTFTIYINPHDHSKFVIEGSGRFFIIRTGTNEIMLSGDFRIPLQDHELGELSSGKIPITVYLYTSNIAGHTTYFHEAPLIYNVGVEQLKDTKEAYVMKRGKYAHEVYLLADGDTKLTSAIHLGNFHFQPDDSQSKIIDLRGLKMVRTDY